MQKPSTPQLIIIPDCAERAQSACVAEAPAEPKVKSRGWFEETSPTTAFRKSPRRASDPLVIADDKKMNGGLAQRLG